MAVVCTGPVAKLTSEFNTKAYFSFNNNKNTRKRKKDNYGDSGFSSSACSEPCDTLNASYALTYSSWEQPDEVGTSTNCIPILQMGKLRSSNLLRTAYLGSGIVLIGYSLCQMKTVQSVLPERPLPCFPFPQFTSLPPPPNNAAQKPPSLGCLHRDHLPPRAGYSHRV